jgi:type II secretion system (T2SS) protein M
MPLGRIRASISRMTARERAMLAAFLGSLCACAAAVLIVLIVDGFGTIQDRNVQMRDALLAIASGRDAYLERRQENTSQRAHLPAAPALQGYLEKAATEAGFSIPESNERPPVPRGKRHVERAVDIKLRDVNLEQLARFLHKIENGPYLVVTSQLSVRPRYGNRDRLDADVAISTFDRSDNAGGAAKEAKEVPKETDEP